MLTKILVAVIVGFLLLLWGIQAYMVPHSKEIAANPVAMTASPGVVGQTSEEALAQEVILRAQDAVRSRLLSPSTAEFPSSIWRRHEYEIRADSAGRTFWVFSHVDSQNVYSARLRQKWGVKLIRSLAARRSEWKVMSVQFE